MRKADTDIDSLPPTCLQVSANGVAVSAASSEAAAASAQAAAVAIAKVNAPVICLLMPAFTKYLHITCIHMPHINIIDLPAPIWVSA